MAGLTPQDLFKKRGLVLLLLSCVFSVRSQLAPSPTPDWPSFGSKYDGSASFQDNVDATSAAPASSPAPPSCSYPKQGTLGTGLSTSIALNAEQFADSMSCGLCLAAHGTGKATGSHSVPHKFWVYGVVTAQVESPLPDLTLLLPGYGTCEAVWTPVQCFLDIDTPYFKYTIGEGAPGTLLVQVTNARVPVVAMTLNGVAMSKTPDNFWTLEVGSTSATPGPSVGPQAASALTLTSMLGDVVDDEPLLAPDTTVEGNAQFPDREFESVVSAGLLAV